MRSQVDCQRIFKELTPGYKIKEFLWYVNFHSNSTFFFIYMFNSFINLLWFVFGYLHSWHSLLPFRLSKVRYPMRGLQKISEILWLFLTPKEKGTVKNGLHHLKNMQFPQVSFMGRVPWIMFNLLQIEWTMIPLWTLAFSFRWTPTIMSITESIHLMI
jgi:hypothetical protein